MDALCDRPCAIGGVTNVKSRHGLVSAEITFPRLVAQRENTSPRSVTDRILLLERLLHKYVWQDLTWKKTQNTVQKKEGMRSFFSVNSKGWFKRCFKINVKLAQVQLVVLLAKQSITSECTLHSTMTSLYSYFENYYHILNKWIHFISKFIKHQIFALKGSFWPVRPRRTWGLPTHSWQLITILYFDKFVRIHLIFV